MNLADDPTNPPIEPDAFNSGYDSNDLRRRQMQWMSLLGYVVFTIIMALVFKALADRG